MLPCTTPPESTRARGCNRGLPAEGSTFWRGGIHLRRRQSSAVLLAQVLRCYEALK